MYAVFKTGGKQYRARQGQVLKVEKLEAQPGATVEFDQVLLIADGEHFSVGAPYVSGAKVSATVRAQGRGRKVQIVKFRRRKHHLKRAGHRQSYTEVHVTGISGGGAAAATED